MFVSETIMEQYLNWKPGDIVVIQAQTGTGKTYFVLNKLLPYVHAQGKRLLYLSNRTALREQVRNSYNAEFDSSLQITNYQSFERTIISGRHPSGAGQEILDCEYWVMDEAHYFLADAIFNDEIGNSLGNILSQRTNHVLIFMTATTDYLFLSLGQSGLLHAPPPKFIFEEYSALYNCNGFLAKSNLISQLSAPGLLLKYKESSDAVRNNYDSYLSIMDSVINNRLPQMPLPPMPYADTVPPLDKFQRKFESYNSYFANAKKSIFYYQSDCDYSHYQPVYFNSLLQLCNRISRTSPTEKWLIFVSSKHQGMEIKTCLNALDVPCIMITAETKKYNFKKLKIQPKEFYAYQSIIDNEVSPYRVTISTSVLDNGINLKDPLLKHIAILEMNPTSFLQMLGRKRFADSQDHVKVYLQSKNIKEIKSYYRKTILEYVRFIAELEFISRYTDTELRDSEPKRANLRLFSEKYQSRGNFISPYSYYVGENSKLFQNIGSFSGSTCMVFQPNPSTTSRLAYDHYRMLALLEPYENMRNNFAFAKETDQPKHILHSLERQLSVAKDSLWIEHQLSWMSLKYDPAHWIDHKNHLSSKKVIGKILLQNAGHPISKNTQRRLRRYIINAVTTSHPPMMVKIGKASLKKLNEALSEFGYNYRIISKNRSINGVQRNYWMVVPLKED